MLQSVSQLVSICHYDLSPVMHIFLRDSAPNCVKLFAKSAENQRKLIRNAKPLPSENKIDEWSFCSVEIQLRSFVWRSTILVRNFKAHKAEGGV